MREILENRYKIKNKEIYLEKIVIHYFQKTFLFNSYIIILEFIGAMTS